MKITKQRLKEIIREELSLGDLQSTDRFTGGSREEQMNILINARDVLSKMSDEKLEELSKSLDAAQTAALRHLLANPMYAPMEEGWKEFAQGADDFMGDLMLGKPRGYSKNTRQNRARRDADNEALSARVSQRAARKKEKATSDKERAQDREKQRKAQDIRNRQLDKWETGQKDQRRRAQKKKEDDLRHSGGPSNRRVSRTTYQEQ